MDSYFSSRAPSSLFQADTLPFESLCPSPFNVCHLVLHDRYHILKALGQGDFAKTFLALDRQQPPNSFCVIKQLFLHNPTNHYQRASALFQQESQRLAAVSEHPQIPQLLDAFEQDGQSFIVQEWIDGWTLEQEVAGTVPFDEVEIWQLLRDLLPVLQYLHDRQIIHRDIKPANIIRRRSPHPAVSPPEGSRSNLVLVDFGAAKQVSEKTVLDAGTLIGSAEYAAPEQILGQAVFASDLYSLGLTCLYLLTQMSPFDLYDMGDATWKWQAYLPQPISPSLQQLLCTLLQPATRRRYQSAAEVLAVIEASGTQAQKPSMRVDQTLSTSVDGAIAAIALANMETASATSQHAAKTDVLPAAIAAIHAARTSRSIAAVTVYSPQTQRWYDFTPETETTDAVGDGALCSGSQLADATTTAHEWENRSPWVGNVQQRQTPIGWRLFTVGIGTAVASVAMTCLWLCISIIFLALSVPPHSSTTPAKADPSAAPR